ncbi:hypothetical protein N7468_009172 [Penicillium chermesinum]|uniref:Uncharacterized protein n=1 Tax=Penicillium chermesinum TaxID=63820 RepID=A0A9W9NJW5_9EURO|nr:uncharacterized protein N7468_009172 [Penicillium chermesinum]KAJ5219968.1 hypothetical protein N7468_009172 [Penicillium chermesinum]KAJ6157426.1 hypothetical protein N7470_005018 [Penicillium chermesinum]
MAELVGVISGGVGIASFALQISSNVNSLRRTYQYNRNKASQELEELAHRLEFLNLLLEDLQPFEGKPSVDLAIRSCQYIYHDMDKALKLLQEKMHRAPAGWKGDWKLAKGCLSRQIREEIHDIGHKLIWMTQMMNTVAFNKFSIPWALLLDFQFILGARKYSLRPALSLQRVVNYTSPGFETIWRCRKGLLPLSEAQDQLRRLNRSPSPLSQHINPAGDNYIRDLLCYGPWNNQNNQFALLGFLVKELDMRLEDEDNQTLIRCASWIGEGSHIGLLEAILELGFDASGIDSPLFQKWPSPCSPNWISEEFTPDPFFLEYLAIISKDNPEFGGSTALHDAVLRRSPATVRSLLSNVSGLEDCRNFLGQTPLHLAVCDPEIFTMVLDAGFDMDSRDEWGITPLMYAAGMGVSEVVQLLISKGANIMAQATYLNRGFVDYASARGHWDLILESLKTIQLYYCEQAFQDCVCWAILRLIYSDNITLSDGSREKYFVGYLDLCENSNFTFSDSYRGTDGNNLLHYVKTEKELHALVNHGFHDFNRPNSEGETPIFSILSRVSNADLLRCCVDNGTDINYGEAGLRSRWEFAQTRPKEFGGSLHEERQAIMTLEQEMEDYSAESLESLRCQLMNLAKERYVKASVASDARAASRRRTYESGFTVDYKNDTFRWCVDCTTSTGYNLTCDISQYAFWLQHEYLRGYKDRETGFVQQGWYERRTAWLVEIISVMGVSLQTIKQQMENIHLEETRLEKIDSKAVVDQFWSSAKDKLA